MPSARDERNKLLTPQTDMQAALMQRHNDLVNRPVTNIGKQLTSTGGIATGLMTLLAGLAGGGDAAASVAVGGLGGLADNVTRDKLQKQQEIQQAELNVYDQVNKDQERALRIMQVDPKAFYESQVNPGQANAALGLPPELDLTGVYARRTAKEDLQNKAKIKFETGWELADTLEEKANLVRDMWDSFGIEYTENDVQDLARENVTYNHVQAFMKVSTPESLERVNAYYSKMAGEGKGLNDPEVNQVALDMLVMQRAPDPRTPEERMLTEAASLWAEANALAEALGRSQRMDPLPVELIMDPASGYWDKSAYAGVVLEKAGYGDRFYRSMTERVKANLDTNAIYSGAYQRAEEYNDQISSMNAEGRFTEDLPLKVPADEARFAVQAAFRNAMEVEYGATIDQTAYAYWRVMDTFAGKDGFAVSDLIKDENLQERYAIQTQMRMEQYAAEYEASVFDDDAYQTASEDANRAFEEYDKIKRKDSDQGREKLAVFEEKARAVAELEKNLEIQSMGMTQYMLARAAQDSSGIKQATTPTEGQTLGGYAAENGPQGPPAPLDIQPVEGGKAPTVTLPSTATEVLPGLEEAAGVAARGEQADKQRRDEAAAVKAEAEAKKEQAKADQEAIVSDSYRSDAVLPGSLKTMTPEVARETILEAVVTRMARNQRMTTDQYNAEAARKLDEAIALLGRQVKARVIDLPATKQEQLEAASRILGIVGTPSYMKSGYYREK